MATICHHHGLNAGLEGPTHLADVLSDIMAHSLSTEAFRVSTLG